VAERRSVDELDSAPATIRAISFDVTGTLISCPRLGDIYSEILGRHGVAVSQDQVAMLFPIVWKEFDCSAEFGSDRFATHPDGARGWWRRFVERLCELAGASAPSRFATAELFDHFRRAEPWSIYPEVVETLGELAKRGFRLAVVSNWDARLPELLDALDLGVSFEAVLYSERVGVEKPHPGIFDALCRELELSPEQILHVGDRRVQDVEGATAAGLAALHVRRPRPGDSEAMRRLSGGRIPNLAALLPAVRAEGFSEPASRG